LKICSSKGTQGFGNADLVCQPKGVEEEEKVEPIRVPFGRRTVQTYKLNALKRKTVEEPDIPRKKSVAFKNAEN